MSMLMDKENAIENSPLAFKAPTKAAGLGKAKAPQFQSPMKTKVASGVITDQDAYKKKEAFQAQQRRIQYLEQELATLNDKHEELLQEKEENTARYRLYQEPKRVRHIQKLTLENNELKTRLNVVEQRNTELERENARLRDELAKSNLRDAMYYNSNQLE
eukprot:TRINITY_DN6584_c0_g1_i1.p1 TRINITY_DN6584_c0_g1~~TRINITY_DN6584_c0_g1_i1.p1  ORF type:complete len:160 (+),score=48.81 TRINITY_DN6584_c0_g1_i1:55-534(+)